MKKKMLPTLIVDNFFDNINDIIKLSKKFKYIPPNKNQNWMGLRTESIHSNHYEVFNCIILKILNYYFPERRVTYDSSFIHFHKLSPGCKKRKGKTPGFPYHRDRSPLTGIIYLSKGDMDMGTTLFNNKKQQIVVRNDLNTLLCYDGDKHHGPTTLDVKKERLTMNIFINKINILKDA